MRKYRGYEFKKAVALAIHKICADLGRPPVHIQWGGTQSASITNRGYLCLNNVKDDAVLTQADLMRYVGYGVHELLHWTYTDFSSTELGWSHSQYVAQLHNALEDAWIEHNGIKQSLTGNITELLTALINGVVAEALTEVSDWSDPAQYPFVLAVYARKHATIKVPLAEGLQPIFAKAVERLNNANNSRDTLDIAIWVYKQLAQLQPPQPPVNPEPPVEPPTNPTNPTDEDGEDGTGDPVDGATEGDQEGDAPTPPTNPAKRPVKPNGEPVTARKVEPEAKPPEGSESGGSFFTADIKRDKYHVSNSSRNFPIPF